MDMEDQDLSLKDTADAQQPTLGLCIRLYMYKWVYKKCIHIYPCIHMCTHANTQ